MNKLNEIPYKKYEFKNVGIEDLDESEYNSFPNKSVLTTIDWIKIVIEDAHATPIILRITCAGDLVGYFTSLTVSKFGFKIIGSPFPGWSTPYMGFDFYDNRLKKDVLPYLVEFLIKSVKFSFFQISDRDITFEESEQLKKDYGYIISKSGTLELDISADDIQLYKKMKTDCRNFIKQFERRGAHVEVTEPNDKFAEEYYTQLIDVFAKQKLVPTYSIDKIKCLLRHLSKSENILCLRVLSPDGISIATGIFPGFNKKFFFFGGASLRSYHSFRPNEYMIYTAMKYWRDRGCDTFDMVGIRDYKRKFGSHEEYYPVIIVSRPKILYYLKNIAASLYYFIGGVKWHINKLLHIKNNIF